MEIGTEALKRCHLVTVQGRIDSLSAPEFETALLDLIEDGAANLVINLAAVDFISSAGISAFIRARVRLKKRIPPGEILISEVSPFLRETFELVGLHLLFTFYDQDVDAVGAV